MNRNQRRLLNWAVAFFLLSMVVVQAVPAAAAPGYDASQPAEGAAPDPFEKTAVSSRPDAAGKGPGTSDPQA